jgi:hypothetical protein
MIDWVSASASRYNMWPELTVKHGLDTHCPSSKGASLARTICNENVLVVVFIARYLFSDFAQHHKPRAGSDIYFIKSQQPFNL